MKKLLGTTLAAAMIWPSAASAELFKNLKVGGQLDIDAVSANNVRDLNSANNDHFGSVTTRTSLALDWDLLDDVHSHVGLVKGDWWNNNIRAYGSGPENLSTVQGSIEVQEANVKIDKLFGFADATLGRQRFGEPGDIVAYFGPRDTYMFIAQQQALDAFRFDWNGDKMNVSGIAGKIQGTNSTIIPYRDEDFKALQVGLKGHENMSVGAYVMNRTIHAAGAAGTLSNRNDNLYVFGVKGKVNVGGLTAKLEVAKNYGDDRISNFTFGGPGFGGPSSNYTGWALLANAAFKADLAAAAVTPFAEFAYGSGRSRTNTSYNDGFVSINSDYRPGGIYGRFDGSTYNYFNLGGASAAGNINMNTSLNPGGGTAHDTNGLDNRVIYSLGVKATPAALNKLTAGIAWYHYAFARTSTFGGQLPRSIGTETDLTAEWKHSENVSMKLTLGSFLPGAYVAAVQGANAAINPATMVALDTSIKF